MKKNKLRVAAAAAILVAGSLSVAVPAHAHYDAWNTHWHYNSYGQQTYKMCSVWDKLWGCQTEVRNYGPIILR